MTQYIKANGNELIDSDYSFEKLRQDNPTKSFPSDFMQTADLSEYGVQELTVLEQPAMTPDQSANYLLVAKPIALIDGIWTKGYELIERTIEQKIAYSEINGDWNAFHFGLLTIEGFIAWIADVEATAVADRGLFKILEGALGNRNLSGMQSAYTMMANKPPEATRIQMQNLANTCGILLTFTIDGDVI